MPSNIDIITRCPQCATAFRATAEVLKVARGTVRCGSCLGVFNASEHAVDQVALKPINPEIETPKKTAPTPIEKRTDETEEDERWALDLLNEENTQDDNTEEALYEYNIDSHLTKEYRSNNDNLNDMDPMFIDIINNDLQENDSDDFIDRVIDDTQEEPTATAKKNVSKKTTLDDTHLEKIESTIENTYTEDPLDSLHELDLSFQENTHKPSRWPWLIGSILMALLLLIQIAWLRFDTLGTQEPYRTYYQKACEQLRCQLPMLSDIRKIKATHLIIRSHSNQTNALVADAILVNEATFAQAFPALQLEFRNIHGDTVARRDFQPYEYLKGELIGATIMPANQAVQLSLNIVDPGESAVNYHISVIPAKVKNDKI
jgi:predicted Zn finger-like uncharacterized protein